LRAEDRSLDSTDLLRYKWANKQTKEVVLFSVRFRPKPSVAGVMLLGALGLSACGPKTMTTAGTKLVINAKGVAARLQCPVGDVKFVEQGDATTIKAQGCGNEEMYTQGDGMWIPMQDLGTRAAFDFDCPKEQLEFTALSAKQQGVKGCGHRATYTYARSDVGRWDWFMDSSATE